MPSSKYICSSYICILFPVPFEAKHFMEDFPFDTINIFSSDFIDTYTSHAYSSE